MLDFIRIACAVPAVKAGDVAKNAQDICAYMEQADGENGDILLLPELALTGYTCGDLFLQDTLLNGAKEGLKTILTSSKKHPQLTVAVGLPLEVNGKLINCGVLLRGGKLLAIVPKTYLSSEEARWFVSGNDVTEWEVSLLGQQVPVGTDLLIPVGEAMVGVEICEDLNAPLAPSTLLALSGANVILNLSASNELAGKRTLRRETVSYQSRACNCIYAYCSAGPTESTADTVYSGHSLIAENGRILKENPQQIEAGYFLIQDCDLGKIQADRRKNETFRASAAMFATSPRYAEGMEVALRGDGSLYPLRKLAFIPETKQARENRCREIFQMQVSGLKQRLQTINANAVIGISGGLDSTLALLVAVEAMHQLGRPSSDVYGVTLPCFGTSDRTYQNAWELMRVLNISAKEISIKEAVLTHFKDIGHDPAVFNGTYENAQARERTQILMDYASVVGGIVIGTGDLSELALGWCTYNGDHMSMYGVNGSVPKTLIRWIIEAVAETEAFAPAKAVLADILDTPISPELLPPDAQGKISQQTEDIVGPYALHDFFLYYVLRFGFAPKKIYALACRAFREDFDNQTVKKWLLVFYKRFFSQQFKRNCMPDGVKVGSIALGPRGDWRMPSDATARLWLQELETI